MHRDRRCSRASPPAGPTSSCRERATSSATARTSTSRARVQRLRRTVIPPVPGRAGAGSRSSPSASTSRSRRYPSLVFEEVSAIAFGGIPFGEIGERAPLPAPQARALRSNVPAEPTADDGDGLALVRYRPLFSGPAVERVPELAVPAAATPEAELSEQDARARGIGTATRSRSARTARPSQLRARLQPRASARRRAACRRTSQATCSRAWRSRSEPSPGGSR